MGEENGTLIQLMIQRTERHTTTKTDLLEASIYNCNSRVLLFSDLFSYFFLPRTNQHRFYQSRSVVRILYPVHRPRFIPCPCFVPSPRFPVRVLYLVCILYPVRSPQSAVRSPQSIFYTDRYINGYQRNIISRNIKFKTLPSINASLSDFTGFFTLKPNQKIAIFVWITTKVCRNRERLPPDFVTPLVCL